MLARRAVSIPAYLLAWSLCIGGAPIWVPACAFVDALRRRRVALRCGAFLTAYFTCEVIGLAACATLSVWGALARPDRARWIATHYALQDWWGSAIFASVVRAFALRVEIDDAADLPRGPYLLLVRHASSADTLLASALVSRRHGTRLRYVLKREILWDPCIDVVGNRLPHVFVDRSSADSEREVRRVADAARGRD